jgi:hypothetical protein
MEQELKDKELRELIYNRKVSFIDSWDDFGLSENKRIEFMKFYWENVRDMNPFEALEEFKHNG